MQNFSGYNFTKIKHTGVSQYLLHDEWIMSLACHCRQCSKYPAAARTQACSRRCHWAMPV